MTYSRLTRIAGTFLAGCLTLASSAHARLDPDLLAGLEARAIGPAAIGGRIAAIDAVNSDPNTIVIGVATGGVWISHSGGLAWEPVFDDQDVASIGAVAINQSNPDIIWVGTGEGNTRNSTSIGGGIYKSVDGGKNWRLMGLENSERIHRIALHPTNPDIVYVAALGTLWAPNTERGIYRSTDGGDSWERILYVNESTGGTDIKMDPSNPDKLIAGMWQFRRWPYHFKSGGPGSGMYVSLDGGDNWEQRTEEDGLPSGELGRMAISISASDPDRIYALVEAEKSAMIHSSDGGVTWKTVNDDYDVAIRPFYYTDVFVDPENPDRVYNMDSRLRISIDGGHNFEYNPVINCCEPGNTIHIDNHAFWINPSDPRHLIIGNDGGVAISRDRGETWRFVRNLPLAQFYHIAVDNEHPYNVYGGLQDNGSWRGPSEVWVPAGIRNLHWQEVGFGDGFDTIPDPENAMAGYVMSQGGYLFRYNLETGTQKMIRPAPRNPDEELRFNWNAGFEQDPFDPATIYYGSQFLHQSTDRGETWTVISGDMTSNNPEWQTYKTSGGLTFDVTAAENYTSIVTVAASRLQRGVLWVGTDDGRVHVTRNGGQEWNRVDERAKGISGAWVPMIYPSPHDAGTAFVVFDDHRRGDMTPYLYRVDDYGRRWTRISNGDMRGYALSIVQDSVNPDLLFAGTELGLYLTIDGGGSWTRFNAGVPTVSVMDMAIQERESDLVLGTHGRSVFIIDDYSALRDLKEDDFSARLSLLSATDGQQYQSNPTASTRFTGSGEYRGPNEPYGVMLTFIASGDDLTHPDDEQERARKMAQRKAAATSDDDEENGDQKPPEVTVRVRDEAGELIRSYKHPVHQGINRLTWNMRSDGVRPAPSPDSPSDDDDDLPAGNEVVPGKYEIELELDGTSSRITAQVVADPRAGLAREQHAARYAAEQSLLELESLANQAIVRIERARSDIGTLFRLLGDYSGDADQEAVDALKEQAKSVRKQLNAMEKRFRVPPRTKGYVYDDDKISSIINMAQYYVGTSINAPSPTALVYVEKARVALDEGLSELNELMTGAVAELSAAVAESGISLFKADEPLQLP